jgi:SIR2-like domain
VNEFDPPYPLIRAKLEQGRVIPFLGAGASLGGRAEGAGWVKGSADYVPSTHDLASHLAATTRFPEQAPLDLTTVAQYFDVVGGRRALEEELHEIFDNDYPLTPLHTYLAEIETPLLMVTTNYDDLVERAFAAAKRPLDVVTHTTNPKLGDNLLWWKPGAAAPEEFVPNLLELDVESTTVLYKMHGAVDRTVPDRDQYVITEDDYVDFLARMTRSSAVPAPFAEAFERRHFLFLGYGLKDWNLRVILSRIDRDLRLNRPRDLTSWAIVLAPSPLERRFWLQRGVEMFALTIDEFVRELRAA